MQLTEDERKAVNALKQLAARWPGTLWVMKKDCDGEVMRSGTGIDQGAAVASIDIENDGGDW
ncbi:MAG: hypothetical protein CVV05_00760 [Gammaproteobacteria bacterium HGW-Gammaproteobacteria-1]|jgi:hypothetical protein|nr:MAG: hypothetical protein CVV05_00760 [Gammaproteobacteria bacterium HGW-Gammaproteobacteria-1]